MCVGPEFAELQRDVETVFGEGIMPSTDRAERQTIQNEIDALVARLYGLEASDLRYILYAPHTFPLVHEEIKAGVLDAFAKLED